jgi:hypothetical protein
VPPAGRPVYEIEQETFVRFFFPAGCHSQGSERLTSECGGGGVAARCLHTWTVKPKTALEILLWNNI